VVVLAVVTASGRRHSVFDAPVPGGRVLSSYERRQFNEIVSGLIAEDPGIVTRHQPRVAPRRPAVALLLWLSMPFICALGGATGVLVALVAGAYGLHLWFRGLPPGPGKPATRPPL
jgi:hypothetical protein